MTTPTVDPITNNQNELHAAIATARDACQTNADSPECAVAWDTVEELQAELAHRRQARPKSSLDTYCDENPSALECRVYDD